MAALRWILLIVGVVFLGSLLWWERRNNARVPTSPVRRDGHEEPDFSHEAPAAVAPTATRTSAPPLRTPGQPLPTIDLPTLAAGPMMVDEPRMGDAIEFSDAFEPVTMMPAQMRATRAQLLPVYGMELRATGIEPTSPGMEPVPGTQPPVLIVDWPPEQERRILTLRLVPRDAERFAGRVLRQALGACGFVHGRLGIYHQPGEDGRAILSAANLSRPGVLDPDNMDFQRFAGLNLFAVLPGALSPEHTLDRLIAVAQDLAGRAGGVVQDEHGVALDAARAAVLRYGLPATSAAMSTQSNLPKGDGLPAETGLSAGPALSAGPGA